MKKIQILIILFLVISFSAIAQKDVETTTIHVDGICDMCKERIENALDVNGVKYAKWDLESHNCEIAYRTDKITEEELHKLLNAVGHDTDKSTASDEEYESVHECCKYRDNDIRLDHIEDSDQSNHPNHPGHSDHE